MSKIGDEDHMTSSQAENWRGTEVKRKPTSGSRI